MTERVRHVTAANVQTKLIPFSLLRFVLLLGIHVVPTAVAFGPLLLEMPVALRLAWVSLSPFVWTTVFVLVAGLASLPFHASIRPGKFPREVD